LDFASRGDLAVGAGDSARGAAARLLRLTLAAPLAVAVVPRANRQEKLMEAGLALDLGMERDRHHVALPDGHRMPLDAGQHLDGRAVLRDPRGADEDGMYRPPGEPLDLQLGLERAQLSPEGVAFRHDVEHSEMIPVQHDQAGAGTEHRVAGAGEAAQRLSQPL